MSDVALPRFGGNLGRQSVDESEADSFAAPEVADIVENADEAATFLKALGHEGRLLILCHLVTGEKSVSELEALLASRQASVSQQLARLRLEGIVRTRRDGQQIYYSILDPRASAVVTLLNRLFCDPDAKD